MRPGRVRRRGRRLLRVYHPRPLAALPGGRAAAPRMPRRAKCPPAIHPADPVDPVDELDDLNHPVAVYRLPADRRVDRTSHRPRRTRPRVAATTSHRQHLGRCWSPGRSPGPTRRRSDGRSPSSGASVRRCSCPGRARAVRTGLRSSAGPGGAAGPSGIPPTGALMAARPGSGETLPYRRRRAVLHLPGTAVANSTVASRTFDKASGEWRDGDAPPRPPPARRPRHTLHDRIV